jgi:hypothetical protein
LREKFKYFFSSIKKEWGKGKFDVKNVKGMLKQKSFGNECENRS